MRDTVETPILGEGEVVGGQQGYIRKSDGGFLQETEMGEISDVP